MSLPCSWEADSAPERRWLTLPRWRQHLLSISQAAERVCGKLGVLTIAMGPPLPAEPGGPEELRLAAALGGRMFHVVRVPGHRLCFSPCLAGLDALEISQAEHGACSLQPASLPGSCWGEGGPVRKRFQQTPVAAASRDFAPSSSAAVRGFAVCGMKRWPELQLTRGTQAPSPLPLLQPDRPWLQF